MRYVGWFEERRLKLNSRRSKNMNLRVERAEVEVKTGNQKRKFLAPSGSSTVPPQCFPAPLCLRDRLAGSDDLWNNLKL
jgi:hypothetical protein